jgi:pimeloyl-ACP methyl ester carboxylesterase
MQEDVDELAGLLDHLGLAPAHLVGNSYGAMVTLRMAVDHPEMCSSVTAHEPPFLHLNEDVKADPSVANIDRIQRSTVELLTQGDVDAGIAGFMNAVLEPDVWDEFPDDFRAYLRASAPSFVDDVNDPEPWAIDLDRLARFSLPIVLTQGESSQPFYGVILDEIARRVPTAHRLTIPNAGHGPHVDRPDYYAGVITSLIHG